MKEGKIFSGHCRQPPLSLTIANSPQFPITRAKGIERGSSDGLRNLVSWPHLTNQRTRIAREGTVRLKRIWQFIDRSDYSLSGWVIVFIYCVFINFTLYRGPVKITEETYRGTFIQYHYEDRRSGGRYSRPHTSMEMLIRNKADGGIINLYAGMPRYAEGDAWSDTGFEAWRAYVSDTEPGQELTARCYKSNYLSYCFPFYVKVDAEDFTYNRGSAALAEVTRLSERKSLFAGASSALVVLFLIAEIFFFRRHGKQEEPDPLSAERAILLTAIENNRPGSTMVQCDVCNTGIDITRNEAGRVLAASCACGKFDTQFHPI
jgi:hypothetical protein